MEWETTRSMYLWKKEMMIVRFFFGSKEDEDTKSEAFSDDVSSTASFFLGGEPYRLQFFEHDLGHGEEGLTVHEDGHL